VARCSDDHMRYLAYMSHRCRWMLPHKKRQRSAPVAKTSYLRGASSRVHARIVGLMDYSTRARHDPTNNERGACSKATRGGRWFLRLDGAAEDGPSAPGRGSSGDWSPLLDATPYFK